MLIQKVTDRSGGGATDRTASYDKQNRLTLYRSTTPGTSTVTASSGSATTRPAT